MDNIPHKHVKYRNLRKPRKLLDLRPSGLLAHANALRKLSKEIHQFGDIPFTTAELSFYNNMIDAANTDANTTIPHVDNTSLNSWPTLCRPHLKCIKKQIKIQALQAKEDAINKRLISRAEDTITNQSRMLSSLLDRDFKKITIDRLVTTDDNNVPTLHTNPDDILELAPKQYNALLRPRNHGFDNLPDDWKEIYDPLQHFPDNIYDDLLLEPTYGEWHEAMKKKCSLNTAPGISGITYLLIKKLHPKVHELLRTFAGIIYRTAIIPMEWKTSQIFSIPKPYDWQFCLERTRPIILLKCLRKLTVRIINT